MLEFYYPVAPTPPQTSFLPLLNQLLPYLLLHPHYFYYLGSNLYANNFYFHNIPLFIDNTAKGLIFHVNNWFGIEFVNLLLLSYTFRSVNRNNTTT
jgi:hypothetical protein